MLALAQAHLSLLGLQFLCTLSSYQDSEQLSGLRYGISGSSALGMGDKGNIHI